VCSLSTAWERDVERGSPSLPLPVTQRPAQVLPFIRGPTVAGSGSTAATTSRGLTSTPLTRTFSVRSRPRVLSTLRMLMNSSPRPYLNVARLQSTQRGMRSTSSCSTLTHSTGPMPLGKSKTSGSEKGAVVNHSPSCQITGGFRHSSIVVHIENDGAKISLPSSSVTTRLAPSRVPSSSISLNRWSAAYLANTSESPGSTPIPTSASRPEDSHPDATANCSSPSLTPVFSYGAVGCGFDSDIGMARES